MDQSHPAANRHRPLQAFGQLTFGLIREARIVAKSALGPNGPSGKVVFLPAGGSGSGSTRLRIEGIAGGIGRLGWQATVLPPALGDGARRRRIAALVPDLVVMQGIRHPLNRPHFLGDIPVLLDLDDADFHIPRFREPLEAAMRDVVGVIAGSRYIANWCLRAGAPETSVIWTSAEVSRLPRPPQAGRPPVVAWAQSRPMNYTAEAQMVRAAMRRLGALRPGVRLRLFDRKPGDDAGFATGFEAPGVSVEWLPRMRYSEYLAAHDEVAVGLAPLARENPFSRGKSFGKILACLDRKVPVIASDLGEPRHFFTDKTGVLADDPARIAQVAAQLLRDARARQDIADRAHLAFRDRLGLEHAVAATADVLSRHVRIGAAMSRA